MSDFKLPVERVLEGVLRDTESVRSHMKRFTVEDLRNLVSNIVNGGNPYYSDRRTALEAGIPEDFNTFPLSARLIGAAGILCMVAAMAEVEESLESLLTSNEDESDRDFIKAKVKEYSKAYKRRRKELLKAFEEAESKQQELPTGIYTVRTLSKEQQQVLMGYMRRPPIVPDYGVRPDDSYTPSPNATTADPLLSDQRQELLNAGWHPIGNTNTWRRYSFTRDSTYIELSFEAALWYQRGYDANNQEQSERAAIYDEPNMYETADRIETDFAASGRRDTTKEDAARKSQEQELRNAGWGIISLRLPSVWVHYCFGPNKDYLEMPFEMALGFQRGYAYRGRFLPATDPEIHTPVTKGNPKLTRNQYYVYGEAVPAMNMPGIWYRSKIEDEIGDTIDSEVVQGVTTSDFTVPIGSRDFYWFVPHK